MKPLFQTRIEQIKSPYRYLSFPIYVLLDLEILSASIEITYSVQVVRLVLLAERRNFPFSTSKAAKKWASEHANEQYSR